LVFGVKEFKPDKQEEVMKKILFSLLLTVVFAVPAFSQMKDMPMKGHGEGHGQMMEMGNMDMMGGDMMCMEHADKMGLTDDQMMKMKPIHREMQKKQIRSKSDLKIAEIELMEIMEVKDFDLDKATSAVKKIENIKISQHLEMLKAMKDMRAILTDEQFKNMHKMCMMKMGEKKHGKMMNKSQPTTKKPADEMKDMKH
jgi:Spy/CpxP family protein refolding chaperone